MPVRTNEEMIINVGLYESTVEEIVEDLLYTMFQSMDEYVSFKLQHGTRGDEITKMQVYIEKEMRKYAKAVYQVKVDKT